MIVTLQRSSYDIAAAITQTPERFLLGCCGAPASAASSTQRRFEDSGPLGTVSYLGSGSLAHFMSQT